MTTRTLIFLTLAGFCIFLNMHHRLEWDTQEMLKGVDGVMLCLAESRPGPCTGAGQFPLFQMVPSLLFRMIGASQELTLRLLAGISFFSFLGVLRILWTSLRAKSKLTAHAAILVMLTGTLLWYSRSSFGEMLSALLILVFTASCLKKNSSLFRQAFWLFLAALTKETAFPFLIALGLLAVLKKQTNPGKQITAFFAAGLLGFFCNCGFNFFRFGSIFNSYYSDPSSLVPDLKQQMIFFAGLWFSPNGGLAPFWPSFFVLITALGFPLLRKGKPGLVWPGVWGLLIILNLGFAKWYAPFGWQAWGPRLVLPWIPSFLLLLCSSYFAEIEGLLSDVFSSARRFWICAVALALVSLPQFGILVKPHVLDRIFDPSPVCPHLAYIQIDPAYYYQCMNDAILGGSPMPPALLQFFAPDSKPIAIVLMLLYLAGLLYYMTQIKKSPRNSP